MFLLLLAPRRRFVTQTLTGSTTPTSAPYGRAVKMPVAGTSTPSGTTGMIGP